MQLQHLLQHLIRCLHLSPSICSQAPWTSTSPLLAPPSIPVSSRSQKNQQQNNLHPICCIDLGSRLDVGLFLPDWRVGVAAVLHLRTDPLPLQPHPQPGLLWSRVNLWTSPWPLPRIQPIRALDTKLKTIHQPLCIRM